MIPRKAPLRRSAPLRTRGRGLKRGKPLKPVSDKRRAQFDQRDEVRRIVLARDRRCLAAALGFPGRCRVYGDREPLEVHEVIARSQWADSWLHPEWCIAICPAHHDRITHATGEDLLLARSLSLRLPASARDNGPPGW